MNWRRRIGDRQKAMFEHLVIPVQVSCPCSGVETHRKSVDKITIGIAQRMHGRVGQARKRDEVIGCHRQTSLFTELGCCRTTKVLAGFA